MAPKKAKKKAAEASSNVFSMFEQAQIQEFKEAFTIMDQNRDGFIDKNDLRDTFCALGRLNVGNDELDEMLKMAPGPINFTIFLSMFGEKLKGTDPEETIINAFKIFDPEGQGVLKGEELKTCSQTSPWTSPGIWTTRTCATLSPTERTRRRSKRALNHPTTHLGPPLHIIALYTRPVSFSTSQFPRNKKQIKRTLVCERSIVSFELQDDCVESEELTGIRGNA
uniref:EF-hand domain-containing protein n=1 Tax=Oncorhynchus kisutch TaxID=8019 RepID=A0A8C7JAB8_ONCKI